MDIIRNEIITFTKEEISILDKAVHLLRDITMESSANGDIEGLAYDAAEAIESLLSEEYSTIR